MNTTLKLSLLGKPLIILNNSPAPSVGTNKAQALLYYLATTGKVYPREELAQLLWPADSSEKAKNSLRVALASLRRVLPEHLIIERQSIAFNMDAPHEIDIHEFDPVAELFNPETSAGEDQSAAAIRSDVDHLLEVLARYKGDYLEDFHIDGAPAFENWLLNERESRRQGVAEILKVAADLLLSKRRYEEAQQVLIKQLELTPWEESLHFSLMETLSRLGHFNQALAQYQSCVEVLANELDAEPAEETAALFQRIQAARAVDRNNLPTEPSPFVGRAEELSRLHTMLTSPDCRLVTIAGLGGIGKSRLALAVARQICQEEALLFLNGVAYISVSSLQSSALFPTQLADGLEIELGSGAEPLTSVIDYLQNREMLLVLDGFDALIRDSNRMQSSNSKPANPYDDESAVATIQLILEDCPDVRCLITSREPLQLALERPFELFGLDYPRSEMVPTIEAYSAVQLFLQGATQVRPGYQITDDEKSHIIKLCQLLGGMPLGIKLSAAWLRAMPTAKVVEEISRNLDFLSTRMRDIDPRQRSMRAVLDYTWELLAEDERLGLASLSIFDGGFTANAAAEVTGITQSTLQAIVRHSLVQAPSNSGDEVESPPSIPSYSVYPEYEDHQPRPSAISSGTPPARYTIHQLVRQYALEKLSQNETNHQTASSKHSSYYVTFLEEQVELFSGLDEIAATEAIASERANIRAAWNWSARHFNPSAIEAIIKGESLYFQHVGPFQEAEAICQLSIDQFQRYMDEGHIDEHAGKRILGKLLIEQVRFLNLMGRYEVAISVADQIVALGAELGLSELDVPGRYFRLRALAFRGEIDTCYEEARDCLELAIQAEMQPYESYCLNMIGFVHLQRNEYDESKSAYEKSLAITRRLGDRTLESTNLSNLGVIAVQQSQYDNAKIYYEQALNLSVETGNRPGEGQRLNNLARVYSEQRSYSAAAAHLRHALHIAQETGDRLVESNTLISIGRNSLYVGDYDAAAKRFEEAIAIKRDMMEGHGQAEVLTYQGLLHQLLGEYRVSIERSRAGLERAREANSAFVIYFALNNLGHALVGLNRLDEAAQAYQEALNGRLALGHRNLSTEPLAGLTDIALRQNDQQALQQHAEPLLAHLAEGTVHGTDQPFRVYWLAYMALRQLQPTQAPSFLQKIKLEFEGTLSQINEPEMQESFSQNVAIHRLILNAIQSTE